MVKINKKLFPFLVSAFSIVCIFYDLYSWEKLVRSLQYAASLLPSFVIVKAPPQPQIVLSYSVFGKNVFEKYTNNIKNVIKQDLQTVQCAAFGKVKTGGFME